MTFTNFALIDEPFSIALDAFDTEWDFHNGAHYLGLHHDVDAERVDLVWRFTPAGLDAYTLPASMVRLRFDEVGYFSVTPGDPAMPRSEDRTVMEIFRVTPDHVQEDREITDYTGTFSRTNSTDFHLVLHFHGGQIVRIGAATVAFVMDTQ